MAIIAIEATTPPTIAAVCELLLPEGDAVEEDEVEGVESGSREFVTVELLVVVVGGRPVGPGSGLVVVEPINVPGPISGLSEKRRCEESRNKKTERRFPTTSVLRCEHIPTILQLASDVGSCQRK